MNHGKEVKIVLTGVWKKLIQTFIDDFEEVMTSVEEVTANVVKIARELEFKVEPQDTDELLPSHDKTKMDEELFLMNEQKKKKKCLFFEVESLLVKIVEMTARGLENYTN